MITNSSLCDSANEVHPDFEKKLNNVRENYFSRNAEKWPVFNEPTFKHIIDFRKLGLAPDERLDKYPKGTQLSATLNGLSRVPEAPTTPNASIKDDLLAFTGALSKDWENPSSVENVVTMPSDPAIYGSMLGVLSNPNLVYREYSGIADDLEKSVVRQIANLAGYDPEQATGIFTQGGTFCNLYGYLAGIRKSLTKAREYGMGYNRDYRIINSQGGHYSNTTNLSLLGVNIREKTIRLKLGKYNDIDLQDLELQLESCFRLNCLVPTIMLTMGTTDTFGVDRVKPVRDLVDRLCIKFEQKVKPHIHVDSAIGWSMIFFLNYDFNKNPLRINAQTLKGILRNTERFQELKHADSFTVDFQKWGYVPYTSSLVMFKNKSDMKYLENDPENFSYFENDTQGQTHLQSTIECSRGAAGLFGAYTSMKYMGVEGYQTMIANCLQNANYFRKQLEAIPGAQVIAPGNQGPSVGFKLYNPDVVKDSAAEFNFECAMSASSEYDARKKTNTDWHRDIFLKRGKVGLYTNWVEFIARSEYDDQGRFRYIPGEKAVFMNPLTTRTEIDQFIGNIHG